MLVRLAILSVAIFLLVATVTAQDESSSNKRGRSFRPRIKSPAASSDSAATSEKAGGDEAAAAAASDDRSRRQLSLRTRKRVQRPPIITPSPLTRALDDGDIDDEETSFTLSRGAALGGPGRPSDDTDSVEEETPRFIPSRGGSGNLAPAKTESAAPRPPRPSPPLRSSSSSSSSSTKSSLAPKLSAPNADGYKVVCYYTNWSQYRPKIGKFLPENIDPFLCTHIIFAFGWIKNGKLTSFESNDLSADGKQGLYQRIVALKVRNPKLKVLLAIGGWSFGTAKFKEVAETRFARQTFIFSCIPYLREHQFDGLDVDWEYPKRNDKENFVSFIKELREAFEYEAEETHNERLLLSAAVPVGPDNVKDGYDVPSVGKHLDFINLMAYDFHGKWEKQAGHNAPLYAPSSDSEWRKQLSVSFAAQMWTKLGAPKEKLVIGMPTYGRSFTLSDPDQYIVNSAAKDGGTAGEYTKEGGFLAYYEVCEMLLNGASYVWDDEMQVPYLVQGDQWVGFDDERSIRNKMDWIKSSGFAGAMVWTVDMDDFNGTVCGSGVKYPLIGAIREELLGTPRETVARGIEPADIDWASVTTTLLPTAKASLPSAEVVDAKQLLKQAAGQTKRVLPAALQPAQLPQNLREPRVFCYYTNWSQKRPGVGKFTPEDIDANLCTHVVYAFATIKDNKIAASETSDLGDVFTDGGYDRVIKLKEQNPKLKVLLAVGGWAFGSKPFQDLTSNTFRMNGFIYDAIEFLRKYNFDGLDIDWEYPKGADDKAAFISLIKEMRLAFEGEHKSAESAQLLLTAAVPASSDAIAAGYDVPELAKYLDYINVMAYDFHGQWEKQVGHNAPLFPLDSASSAEKKLTVDFAAKEWVRQGAPLEKLLIGMPVYGRSFTLADPSKFDVGSEVTGGGTAGRYTGEEGFLSHYEICDFLQEGNTTLVWDNEQQVPFAYHGDQWIGFDDERSLRTKIDWLKKEGFGGIMIWSVDLDDFRGHCGTGKYPLLKAMNKELEGYKVNLVYKGPYDNKENEKVKEKPLCNDDEGQVSLHRDKNDCSMYFVCQGPVQYHKACPDGLVFNENENVCDWPSAVEACASLVGTKK